MIPDIILSAYEEVYGTGISENAANIYCNPEEILEITAFLQEAFAKRWNNSVRDCGGVISPVGMYVKYCFASDMEQPWRNLPDFASMVQDLWAPEDEEAFWTYMEENVGQYENDAETDLGETFTFFCENPKAVTDSQFDRLLDIADNVCEDEFVEMMRDLNEQRIAGEELDLSILER